MSNERLNALQRSNLRRYEAVIEKGKHTFLEVGNALKCVRDEKLYIETHKTFDAYVKERWEFDKTYASRLIAAASIRDELLPIGNNLELPKTESAYREVAKAPPEKRVEVLEVASEIAKAEEREPTAKDYRNAVEVVTATPKQVEPEPKSLVMSKAEQAVFNASILGDILKALRGAKKMAKDVQELPGMELFLARQRSIEREILSACDAVQVTIPHSVCPRCDGKGCPQCGNHGWVNSVMARELENAK